MTTRTDDRDNSSNPFLADTPTSSDAPAIAAYSTEPTAGNVTAVAEISTGSDAATATDADEAGIREPFVPELGTLESILAEPGIPTPTLTDGSDAIVPDLVPSVPVAAAAPPVSQSAAPVSISPPPLPQAPRTAAPLAPPFLREHERRPTGGRPAPAVAHGRKAAAPPPPAPKAPSRFPLLAATLALAACLGAAVGAVGVSTFVKSAHGTDTPAVPAVSQSVELESLRAMVAQHAADLGALKASLEQSAKATTAQYGKIAERLDRSDRAQAEPNAKLAKIFEAVERLEKRPVPAAAAPADITGTVPSPQAEKPKPTILDEYVLRRVFDGVALVEGRRGIIEVEPGATLPGAGRIEEIRRQDGRWVVVTQKGLIVSPR